jgi:hypothetical protein
LISYQFRVYRIGTAICWSASVCAAVALLTLVLQSCGQLKNFSEGMTHPMTPEESKAQVVDAARDIVRILGLKGVSARFSRESCNDQAVAPFRGVVGLDYDHAPTLDESRAEIQRMLAVLKQHGWSDPSDFHTHAPAVSKQGVTAVFNPYSPVQNAGGYVSIYGECRDMTTQKNSLPEPIPADQLE